MGAQSVATWIERIIGQIVAASSRPMPMLNHFSRAGSARKPRSAMPKPAQQDTLGRLISVNMTTTTATDRKGCAGSV